MMSATVCFGAIISFCTGIYQAEDIPVEIGAKCGLVLKVGLHGSGGHTGRAGRAAPEGPRALGGPQRGCVKKIWGNINVTE
jgi:hypothetical protein